MKLTIAFARITFFLLLLQLLLILFSWMADVMQWCTVESLLKPAGIRWMLSRYCDNLASPVLVWLLLIACTYGVVKTNRQTKAWADKYQRRMAMMICSAVGVLMLGKIILLAFVPHAVMLSITGRLLPSPFLDSLIPMLCIDIILLSWIYGGIVGCIRSLKDAFSSLVLGISYFAPIVVLYLVVAQLIYSFKYVF